MVSLPVVPASVPDLLVFGVGLIILWVVVSIPVYFAGKAVTSGRSTFGNAMRATLVGALVYFIVFFLVAFFLGAVIGSPARPLAAVLGVIAWLAVFRGSFDTGWLGAVGIVTLAWVILVVLDVVLVTAFGAKFPDFFPF